jgi:hypothetical protein
MGVIVVIQVRIDLCDEIDARTPARIALEGHIEVWEVLALLASSSSRSSPSSSRSLRSAPARIQKTPEVLSFKYQSAEFWKSKTSGNPLLSVHQKGFWGLRRCFRPPPPAFCRHAAFQAARRCSCH